ncbi:MAG: S-layer homology domain-containing protein [Peptostreptococcales bacterium]
MRKYKLIHSQHLKEIMKKGLCIFMLICLFFTSGLGSVYGNTASENHKKARDYLIHNGLDEWGILTLYALGEDVRKQDLKMITSKLTTDYEAYICGAVAQGKAIGSVVDSLKKAQLPSGKFADEIDKKGEDLVNAHIWAVIALYVAGEEDYNQSTALKWLSDQQNKDGGFPVFVGDNYSDLDLTAMATIAYSILGVDSHDSRIIKAFDFIEKNMAYEETCEALAWVIIAQNFNGKEVSGQLLDKLKDYRLEDGTYRHLQSIKNSNYMATYSGLLAMREYDARHSIFKKLHWMSKFQDLTMETKHLDAITYLMDRDIIKGYDDETFKPDQRVKRSEFAKMLILGMGLEDKNPPMDPMDKFLDMKDHWAKKFVNIAYENELIQGVADQIFAPEKTITGAEIAAILVRANGLEALAKKNEGKNWYEAYVKIALERDLLYEGFSAEKEVIRSQCAEVIKKLMLVD